MFTEKNFNDLKYYFEFAREHLIEYNEYEDEDCERMDEIEAILQEYINTEPNKEESPE